MARILIDTNIFIDLLTGVHQATLELSNYDLPAISVITYMELMAGAVARPTEQPILDAVLKEFTILQLDQQTIEQAIEIRGNSLAVGPKVKMPDAIIGATARVHNIPLVTRNPRDFNWSGINVHIPYDFDSKTGVVTNIRPAFDKFPPRPPIKRIR